MGTTDDQALSEYYLRKRGPRWWVWAYMLGSGIVLLLLALAGVIIERQSDQQLFETSPARIIAIPVGAVLGAVQAFLFVRWITRKTPAVWLVADVLWRQAMADRDVVDSAENPR